MGAVDPDDVRRLIADAEDVDHGPARIAIVEEAVRTADSIGDESLGYAARMAMLEAAVFGGYPEKALVAFGWLVALCDREPERFPQSRAVGGFLVYEVDLLWAYKWVVQNTPAFSQISRQQIESTLGEMRTRYQRHGFSTRPVWMSQIWVGMEVGESEEQIASYFSEWLRAERDAYADCEACEQSFEVEVQRYLGNWEAEVRAAQPLLDGTLSCAEVPHITISNLMMPMWLHGEHEQAARLHTRGYHMCRDNRDFLSELAEHVDYRIVTGDLEGAATLAERHMPWIEEARAGRRKWRWFVTLGELFARIAIEGGHAVRIPRELAPDGDITDPAVISRHFRALADDLSADFDRRNGNDSVSRRAAELRARLQS